jgi:hypothetical protein
LIMSGCTIPAFAECFLGFAWNSGLVGGMPGDTALFDTAIVTETTQS